VQSRYQEWKPGSFVVSAIWLAFYAIAIVGAVTWSQPTDESPEMAAVVGMK
jgi:tryptophan-rich sensory protein